LKALPFKGESARLRTVGSRADKRPQQERRAGLLGEEWTPSLATVGWGWFIRINTIPIPAFPLKGKEKSVVHLR